MAKFGELINLDIPVLIEFFQERNNKTSASDSVLNKVAREFGKKAKIVKINVDKNRQLVEALEVKKVPTLVIFRGGDLVWRQNDFCAAEELISALNEHI